VFVQWRVLAGTIPLLCCQLSGVNLFGNYSSCESLTESGYRADHRSDFFSLAGFSNAYLVQVLTCTYDHHYLLYMFTHIYQLAQH
jgi:hypothetical protein